jgi:hypothetical protein
MQLRYGWSLERKWMFLVTDGEEILHRISLTEDQMDQVCRDFSHDRPAKCEVHVVEDHQQLR